MVILHPSQTSKESLQKNCKVFMRSETNVSNNHESPYHMQSACDQIPLTLPEKVLSTTTIAIRAFLATFITSEIIQNQNHEPQRGIARLCFEAKHQPSCFKSFHTAFFHYERGAHRAQKKTKDTELTAYNKTFASLLEHIQTHFIKKKKKRGPRAIFHPFVSCRANKTD